MKSKTIKIGVAGTHSTGKTTLMDKLDKGFSARNLKIGRIDNLARRAHSLGFPILTQHTFESTLWIMAECIRQEAEASLTSDVILVDRPVLDALGYLDAALQITGRRLDARRYDELKIIARTHSADYDILIVTALDRSIPLGDGRDTDQKFREAAADRIRAIVSEFNLTVQEMTSENSDEIALRVSDMVIRQIDSVA